MRSRSLGVTSLQSAFLASLQCVFLACRCSKLIKGFYDSVAAAEQNVPIIHRVCETCIPGSNASNFVKHFPLLGAWLWLPAFIPNNEQGLGLGPRWTPVCRRKVNSKTCTAFICIQSSMRPNRVLRWSKPHTQSLCNYLEVHVLYSSARIRRYMLDSTSSHKGRLVRVRRLMHVNNISITEEKPYDFVWITR
jgi:hypothetical protein